MKAIHSVLIVLLASFMNLGSYAQVGEMFPEMSGEKPNNTTETIPTDTKGKFTLVGVAYSEDAERDLRTWYKPTYAEFIDKNGINALVYDAHVRLVLMFTGVKKSFAKKAMKNMEQMADKDLLEHVIFYKGELKKYKKDLKMNDKSKPYLFVLDKEGKVIHATSGRHTAKKMLVISELMEE